ncbi:MAG: AraC family transcriptional regulator ligand-binding domain-containing protein [Paucibacter sp.]|nr:AraC family transcriptional regulator ligand-binding domain-containing protein [Roseateles sp.]
MNAPSRRVPARYIVLLLDALKRQGTDVARLMLMAGLEEERVRTRDATLLPTDVEAFVSSVRRITGRSDLGFEFGRMIKMNSHDILGYGMLSVRTIDELLKLVTRHYHLMIETFTMRYHRTGRRGEVVYTPSFSMPLETLRFYYEGLAMAHQNQVQLLLGDASPAYDIYLSMPEPPHVTRYLALAPVRFHFEERALPGVRVVMDAEWLDRPLPLADARVVEDVDKQCTALGQRPPAGETGWGDYVTMMLRQVQGDLVTRTELARRMNVSSRTIDRYLKKENLQFRDLAQQVRFERACALLGEPGAKVAQVALNLGFSDSANFSRAFRRVIGVAPSEYQRQLADGHPPVGSVE